MLTEAVLMELCLEKRASRPVSLNPVQGKFCFKAAVQKLVKSRGDDRTLWQ